MTDLNRELVFEYSAQFADQLQPITQDVGWHAYLTYADVCRALYVGERFLEVLWSDFDRLLKTTHAIREQIQLSSRSPSENTQRALNCLRQIIEILDFARIRWGLSDMRQRFEQESAVLFSRLRSRQTDLGSERYSNVMPVVNQPPANGVDVGRASLHYYPNPNQYAYEQPASTQLPTPPMQQDINHSDNGYQQHIQTPPGEHDVSGGYLMPQGSLPRRSYEFYGGQHRS
jgi:hypothetical protein